MNLLITGSVFGLVLAVWITGVWVWRLRKSSRAQMVEQRLGLGGSEGGQGRVLSLWREDGEVMTVVKGAAAKVRLAERLDQFLKDAGWERGTGTFLLGMAGVTALTLALSVTWLDNFVMGLISVGLILIAVRILLKRGISRRAALFDQQLVDALDLIARSLRAGHPLTGAFRIVAEETAPPVGTIFDKICQQQALGVSLEEALRQAAGATTSAEMKLLAASVIIQSRSGGNLADLMGRVAFVIRDRMRLSRRVHILTAQTQLSKRILLALPVIVFLLLNLLNPEYMSALYETSTGTMVLAMGGASLALGAWSMNRLTILKY